MRPVDIAVTPGAAARLAEDHARGARSVHDSVSEALARAHAAQAACNCFVVIDDEGALAAADALDAAIAAGAPQGPLLGVPVAVKDILDSAGLPTRWGAPSFRDAAPAKADIAAVARLKAAGAVVIGKTTTTEFAHSPLGFSPLTGLTLNPFAAGLTCGGSSAGAGASVALGVTPLTLATDAGCSARLPAAATGVYGFKPTLSRVPHERVPDAFGSFIHLGLMARHVADLALGLDVASGPVANDPWSLRGAPEPANFAMGDNPLEGARVLLWLRTGNSRVAGEVEATTRRAAEVLEALGARVEEEAYGLAHPDPIWKTLQQTNWASRFASAGDAELAQLSPALAAGIREARAYSALDLARAQIGRAQLFRAVQGLLETRFDFILTPCVSAPLVAADFDLSAPLVVDGVEAGPLRAEWTAALSLFDLTGHPAIALPVGLAANGGPLGVQLVGRWNADATLLAAAAAFETALPPPPCPGV
ncbi:MULTISPECIES: amidase [unclassified Xanthobacter]|uniref:amidase n=1 Tax=unclassified Xanthobacter TaxID=2623496 RepID=UPI001EDF230E|nr:MULTISPECIES: amidase family protein [unclassified Xanthobacter]